MSTHKTDNEGRHFAHGSSGAMADSAVDGAVAPEERAVHAPDAPYAREAEAPLKKGEKPDQLAAKEKTAESRQEALIDEGVEESFPASDPLSAKRIT